jgi:hypothetical protein
MRPAPALCPNRRRRSGSSEQVGVSEMKKQSAGILTVPIFAPRASKAQSWREVGAAPGSGSGIANTSCLMSFTHARSTASPCIHSLRPTWRTLAGRALRARMSPGGSSTVTGCWASTSRASFRVSAGLSLGMLMSKASQYAEMLNTKFFTALEVLSFFLFRLGASSSSTWRGEFLFSPVAGVSAPSPVVALGALNNALMAEFILDLLCLNVLLFLSLDRLLYNVSRSFGSTQGAD